MRPTLEAAFNNNDEEARLNALVLLSRMQLGKAWTENLLSNGLKDSSKSVRIQAAMLAAKLGYNSLANRIVSLLRMSKESDERENYCIALTKLNIPCK